MYKLSTNQQNKGDYATREKNLVADMVANQDYIRHLEAITQIKKVSDGD